MNILIVDDDPLFRELSTECFALPGCTVVQAGDGVEALECVDACRFHLAIIDLSMPRLDGLRLIPLIRGSPRHRDLVIVVVSSQTVYFEEAMQLGADAVLAKPVDWSELRSFARPDALTELRLTRRMPSAWFDPVKLHRSLTVSQS